MYISELSLCAIPELNGQEKSFLLKFGEPLEKTESFHSYLWFRKQPALGPDDEKHLAILLKHNLVEEIHGNRFRRGSRNYALTTCGLFYILTENRIFSNLVLIRYCENVILRKLLFEYLDANTVKHWSPRFGAIISEYLHKCCITSRRTIELIKPSKTSEEKDKHSKLLELDLKEFALSLKVKLTGMYYLFHDTINKKNATYEYLMSEGDVRMFSLLSKDDKFSRFRINVLNELDEAYKELARLKVE